MLQFAQLGEVVKIEKFSFLFCEQERERERERERDREREVGMTSTCGEIPGAFYRREIETSLTICQTT